MRYLLIELINNTDNLKELEATRSKIFGKNGVLTKEFKKLKTIEASEKKEFAANINSIKQETMQLIEQKKQTLQSDEDNKIMQQNSVDVTMFKSDKNRGALHPVNQTMNEVIDYFLNLNFSIEDGPLIEDDFFNFEALNLPKHHPARDMQDTFYFKDEKLLRTHTSPVQIRTMKKTKPPIRMISPGSVFRRDFDLTHTPMFHQVEGLVVDDIDKVSFANLKSLLENFLTHMFGDVKVRFRPSFFPFTEPSAEVDISCIFCEGDGCRVCSHTGWLEVLGCGLVDPNVFKAIGYEDVSGYAFGLGIERFTMLLRKIPDLRSLYEGDLRLLEQFR